MSDLISRQAILKNIEKIRQSAQMIDDTHRADIIMQGMYLCEKAVRNQPSAQQWIPCSERLPEVGDIVLGTDSYGSVDTWVLQESFAGKLYWTDPFEERAFDLETVIAWMPLPEPYTKDGDTDDVTHTVSN